MRWGELSCCSWEPFTGVFIPKYCAKLNKEATKKLEQTNDKEIGYVSINKRHRKWGKTGKT